MVATQLPRGLRNLRNYVISVMLVITIVYGCVDAKEAVGCAIVLPPLAIFIGLFYAFFDKAFRVSRYTTYALYFSVLVAMGGFVTGACIASAAQIPE